MRSARATAAALGVLLVAGCSDGVPPQPETTPVIIPGSTVGPIPVGEPTAPPSPTQTPTPSAAADVTSDELLALVGGAMAQFRTVHLDAGNESPPADFVIDLDFIEGDLDLEVAPVADGAPVLRVRRVEGRLFLDAGDATGWQEIDVDDPRLTGGEAGILPQVLAFDLIADLRATLTESTDLEALGSADVDGASVEQYAAQLDVADLTQPSFITQVEATGTIGVVVSLDPDGLPVRIDYDIDPGTVTRLDFSGWGDPVDVEVPDVG